MMGKFIDLSGQRFGRLTVIERAANDKHGEPRWLCRCDCGNHVIVLGSSLRSGHTKSCGCLQREHAAKIGKNTATHRLHNTRIYNIWSHMKSRCTSPKDPSFANYGCRGTTVCEEWQRFEPFYKWAIANGYDDTLSIDRIDVNGGYRPENCRWATMKEQQRNKRNNHYVTYDGETKTITEWAEKLNIRPETLHSRLRSGWSIEKALTTPVNKNLSRSKK